jgi:hypothetical protein
MTAAPPVGRLRPAARTGIGPAELLGAKHLLVALDVIGAKAHLRLEVAILVRHGAPASVPWRRGAGCYDAGVDGSAP